MPTTTRTLTNIVPMNLPEVSAYLVERTFSSGAYGASTAQEFQDIVDTLNALVAANNARRVTAAS